MSAFVSGTVKASLRQMATLFMHEVEALDDINSATVAKPGG
ncbi:hypothetical protein [Streptomyces hokutonensis]